MSRTLDAAVRLRKQRLDDLRRDLGVLFLKHEELQMQLASIDAELEAEMQAAAGTPFVNFSAYHAQNRQSRAAASDRIESVEAEIDALRTLVAEAFEDFKAVDVAAERFAEQQRLAELRAEQSALDEIAAQRHS